jgi:NAD(P)-dependent dehydrogenase (short-subunit alcohol dehydrogenase family)
MKSIFITGGGGKIGFTLTNHFLKNNYLVVITTRNKKKFLSIKKNNLFKRQNLHIIEVDFLHKNAEKIISSYLSENKINIEHIIHNARSLDFLSIDKNGLTNKENFMGEFFLDVVFPCQLNESIINLENSNLKNIIFISSIYGIVAPTPTLYENFKMSSPINYGVCKAAQIHLTKELAVRLAPKIKVNCISFGGIKGRSSKEFIKKYSSLNPLGKMLEDHEVIEPIQFLISENLKSMTGHNLIIDGGWTTW